MAKLMRLAVHATNRIVRRPHREIRGVTSRWIRFLRRFPSYYHTLYNSYTVQTEQLSLQQIHLELTNHCNLRCISCNQPKMPLPTGFMSLEEAKELIDQSWTILGKDGVLGFFIRGESLLHKDLPKMIAYARQKGFEKLLLSTNAMLLTKEKCQQLLDSGIQEVRISIDAVEEEDFHRIRMGAKLKNIDENIRYLHRIKEQQNNSCRLRLHASLHKNALLRVPEFIRRWNSIFDYFCFTIAVNQGGLFSKEEAESFSELPFANSQEYKIPCRILYNYIGIHWDKSMSSCCVDYHNQFVVGHSSDGIEPVFQNSKSQAIRMDHAYGKWGPLCTKCGFNNILVDWFEDEVNDYVRKYRQQMQNPAYDSDYEQFLRIIIAKFNYLAQNPPKSRPHFFS